MNPWLAALATSGIIFAAVYLLWMYQRVIFGAVTHEENRRARATSRPREWAVLAPVVVLIVWIGVLSDGLHRQDGDGGRGAHRPGAGEDRRGHR